MTKAPEMLQLGMRNIISGALSVFKYIISLFMMFAGYATATGPITPIHGALGFLYSSRIALITFGIIFFVSGALLMIGKILKQRRIVGCGLAAIFCCFLFAGILNGTALGWEAVITYLPNFIAALITGALYIRWRLKFFYTNQTKE